MTTDSSFLACRAFPVRTPFIPGKICGAVLRVTLLALVGASALARADVVTHATGSRAIVEALSHDGVGLPGPRSSTYGGYTGVGDHAETLRAYQEEANIFQDGPDLVAVAEAKLDYTAHASSHQFSAAVNYSYFVDVNVVGAATYAGILFAYYAQFEVTEAIEFHAQTWFGSAGINSFGSRFALDRSGSGEAPVFGGPDSEDSDQNLDLTGVLQPGLYDLSYRVEAARSYSQFGSLTLPNRAESFLFTLGAQANNPPAVPDTVPTLALLAFGLASLIATVMPAARNSRGE